MVGVSSWISFKYDGQLPSKSNYHHNAESKRTKRWGRIKAAEKEIGDSALVAWSKKYTGSMLMHSEGKECIVTILCVNQRIDGNNAPKLICDALEKICYHNDKDIGVTVKPSTNYRGPPYVGIRIDWN